MFGPYDADEVYHPHSLSYAVIGTGVGIKKFSKFSERLRGPIFKRDDTRLWPVFPGFEASFNSQWPLSATRTQELDEKALSSVVNDRDAHKRAGSIVEMYLVEIVKVLRRDEGQSLVFLM